MTNEERLSADNSQLKILLWEARHEQNLKGYKLQYEVLKDKYKERGKQIIELEVQAAAWRIQVQGLEKQIRDLQAITSGTNIVVLQIEANEVGRYVHQEKYIKLLNELKQYRNGNNEKGNSASKSNE